MSAPASLAMRPAPLAQLWLDSRRTGGDLPTYERVVLGRLELEITEGVLLADNEANLATLHDLRALGVRIAMDDFGTGYSSLSYLRAFPFDKIKIDRSFVSQVGENLHCTAIVRAVTGLAASLGIVTTAEGVETAAQLAHLRAEGCHEAQGFLFSKPVCASQVLDLLSRTDRDLVASAA